ncbi:MAG: hypothetical protein M1813_007587 [Trichoglossum hirsutum]|nr:MAG: hypothetical protein M1813_007587 [Trichoglossum hirsutum]
MNLDSPAGLPANVLSLLRQTLQDEPISREFHAFCHLCPPDAPAIADLPKLDKEGLVRWSKTCFDAINEWCCCSRDYAATPDAPSLTSRNSRLSAKVKERDGHCVVTRMRVTDCHAAHIFPYALGKSRDRSNLCIWDVLEMFWGRERKERLHKVIFGDPSIVLPESKTFINGLYNMITLSRDSHGFWGGGYFILEPLDEASSQYELKARFEWIPQRSGTGGVKVDTNPATFETLPFGAVILTDAVARTFVEDGHTITFRTNDPVNAPLPDRDLLMLQGFLIRVLRLAGRAGDDMLGTVESDDGVSVDGSYDIDAR